jgi:hypothetical protein
MKPIRAAISPEYQEKLKELGEILGHSGVSQTIEFIMRRHLDEELKSARTYRDIRQQNSPDPGE